MKKAIVLFLVLIMLLSVVSAFAENANDTTTWKPPENLSYAKMKKMAEVEAYKWEQFLMGKGDQPHGELTSPALGMAEASKTAEVVQEE